MDDKFFDWHAHIETTSGVLPHWHQSGKLQFVTFHLGDSLPQIVLQGMERDKKMWLATHTKPWDKEVEAEYHNRFSQFVDKWFDKGAGSCILGKQEIAGIVEDSLLYFNGERYLLHAYVIMPNHVHLLVEITGKFT